MDIVLLVKAAIMGVVEGLTEFLPISSTGHLILAGSLLGFDDAKAQVFDIAIQTGAIFAVILVYWQKIRATLAALPTEQQAQRFALNVLIAFVPAVLLGLLFGKDERGRQLRQAFNAELAVMRKNGELQRMQKALESGTADSWKPAAL